MRYSRVFTFARLALAALMLLCALAASANVYEVGPGKQYTSLGAVPWNNLGPGDAVNIYWRAEPYREKVLISSRGSAQAPIQINGIANASGQMPVIDGDGATTSSQFNFPYAPTQDRGLVILSISKGYQWGFKPGYVVIQGLELRNSCVPNSYTDGQGLSRSYTFNAAAIYVERGEHLTVRNCEIHNSGNGFFVGSGGSEELQSRDILMEHCYLHDNGNVGRDREHNIYTESIGAVFQYNHLGLLRPGALGNNLKDRSAGTIVRYNWIEGGGHLLDLVEAEDSYLTAMADPSYRTTLVYGNVFVNPQVGGAVYMIHYGGDNGDPTTYRKGVLYFYDNTVLNLSDQTGPNGKWRTVLLQLETNDESSYAVNNIVCTRSVTAGISPPEMSLMCWAGQATFGVNWVSSGWMVARSGDQPFTGTVTGLNNLFSNAKNDPGFVNLANGDLHLAANSPNVGVGGPLPAEIVPFGPFYQYAAPALGTARPTNAAGPDLGAFGYGTAVSTALFSISGRVTSQGVGLAGVTVSTSGLSANTAADGTYTLAGLPAKVYTVSAAKTGWTLSGAQSVNLTADRVGVNFTAARPSSISGKVTVGNTGVAGVAVTTDKGGSAVTASDGTYSITGLNPGSYVVTAAKTGFTFSAPQTVDATSDAAGINFSGQAVSGGGVSSGSGPAPVNGVNLVSFTVSSTQIKGYDRPIGTITLDRPVPTDYITVQMTSSNPAVIQVYNIQIWGSQSGKSFEISTLGVSQPTDVIVTATYGGVTKSVTITVSPLHQGGDRSVNNGKKPTGTDTKRPATRPSASPGSSTPHFTLPLR